MILRAILRYMPKTSSDIARQKNLEDALSHYTTLIGEHADSVQIFASLACEDGSEATYINRGSGDYFIRVASVDHWLLEQKEFQKMLARKKALGQLGGDHG